MLVVVWVVLVVDVLVFVVDVEVNVELEVDEVLDELELVVGALSVVIVAIGSCNRVVLLTTSVELVDVEPSSSLELSESKIGGSFSSGPSTLTTSGTIASCLYLFMVW